MKTTKLSAPTFVVAAILPPIRLRSILVAHPIFNAAGGGQNAFVILSSGYRHGPTPRCQRDPGQFLAGHASLRWTYRSGRCGEHVCDARVECNPRRAVIGLHDKQSSSEKLPGWLAFCHQ